MKSNFKCFNLKDWTEIIIIIKKYIYTRIEGLFSEVDGSDLGCVLPYEGPHRLTVGLGASRAHEGQERGEEKGALGGAAPPSGRGAHHATPTLAHITQTTRERGDDPSRRKAFDDCRCGPPVARSRHWLRSVVALPFRRWVYFFCLAIFVLMKR